jgi:hypothetical protein
MQIICITIIIHVHLFTYLFCILGSVFCFYWYWSTFLFQSLKNVHLCEFYKHGRSMNILMHFKMFNNDHFICYSRIVYIRDSLGHVICLLIYFRLAAMLLNILKCISAFSFIVIVCCKKSKVFSCRVLGSVIFKLDMGRSPNYGRNSNILFQTGGGRNETLFNDIVSPMVYV